MNKQEDNHEETVNDSLKPHYDFDYSKAKPNRFASRLAQERLMVVLDPDIAAVFPSDEAVNDALRVLMASAKNLPTEKPKRHQKQHPSATQPVSP